MRNVHRKGMRNVHRNLTHTSSQYLLIITANHSIRLCKLLVYLVCLVVMAATVKRGMCFFFQELHLVFTSTFQCISDHSQSIKTGALE